MADSAAFELCCEILERASSLDRLEARGTVRLALKEAGFDSRNVSSQELAVVARKLLGGELEARGVAEGERICSAIVSELSTLAPEHESDTPEAVFARLGSR